MNKTKLLKLAALLDNVPPEKFYMGTWARGSRLMGKQPVCATVACALGWATAIPEFAAEGLKLQAAPGDCNAEVVYRGAYGEEAGQAFFDLTETQAYELFLGGRETPKGKAAEIRALVKRRK